ncbi:MAG: alpha/beta fold hydrolase [Rhodospirillales bacterium]|jgi:pimeloyl-ACP methyl ester carboxylesterase
MPLPERKSLDLPGGVITYREAGEKNKNAPTLAFLHGINIHSGIWGYQFDHFAKTHHVVAWDAPSYGRSASRDADVGVYAGAFNEFLDALDLDKAILVGHSMGGIISGGVACYYPERIKALVLSCTHTGAAKPKGQPLLDRYQARIDERSKHSQLDYGRLQAAKMTTDATPKELTEEIAVIVSETSGESFANNARMGQEADNRDGLKKFTAPTLIINGAGDRLGPSDGQKTLLATMPDAQQIVFEQCGHSPYLEDPAAYNDALDKFFGSLK